jgi:hypothetical protein
LKRIFKRNYSKQKDLKISIKIVINNVAILHSLYARGICIKDKTIIIKSGGVKFCLKKDI